MPRRPMEGDSHMQHHNSSRAPEAPPRLVAPRDLRFAGTVAAGLVAGVLGLGAITAPLIGWTEWPSGPSQSSDGVVRLEPEQTGSAALPRPADDRRDPGAAPEGTAPAVLA